MDLREPLDLIAELIASQLEDAPKQLEAIAVLASRAIQGQHFGEALSLLRQAQALVDGKSRKLAKWRAEVAALWAVYYARGGPELEPNAMWHKIAEAQRLEPGNKRLMDVIELLKAQRNQQ